jgi:hypothetical protein
MLLSSLGAQKGHSWRIFCPFFPILQLSELEKPDYQRKPGYSTDAKIPGTCAGQARISKKNFKNLRKGTKIAMQCPQSFFCGGIIGS